jgi:hypothetical protein
MYATKSHKSQCEGQTFMAYKFFHNTKSTLQMHMACYISYELMSGTTDDFTNMKSFARLSLCVTSL